MPGYEYLLKRCLHVNKISARIIDEFLLNYAAKQDKVDDEFENRFSRFRKLEKDMPSNWKGLIKAQYIAHRIFRQEGHIHKYLSKAAITARNAEEQEFLRHAAAAPWRFCFSEIIKNPSPDFFEMEDTLTGETFQLYSPSVSRILSEQQVLLWFNLIGYNGSCWQTFGPVSAFQSFDLDDIYFYATELNSAIDSENDLITDLEDNPVRYMVLASGSAHPRIFCQKHESVQVAGEGIATRFDVQELRKDFRVEYAGQVFKLTHQTWSEPPHFAEAYYEEGIHKIFLHALTDLGYTKMSAILIRHSLNIPTEPGIRLHFSMTHFLKKALGRTLEINPYGRLFYPTPSPDNEEQMSKLNRFLSLAMPYINSGKRPDIAALAREAGVDTESATEIFQKVVERINKLGK